MPSPPARNPPDFRPAFPAALQVFDRPLRAFLATHPFTRAHPVDAVGTGALIFSPTLTSPSHSPSPSGPAPNPSSASASTPSNADADADADADARSRDRVLLIRRAAADSMPNRWEVPGGGVDGSDASVLAGCAREVFEETGLRVVAVAAQIPWRGVRGRAGGKGEGEGEDEPPAGEAREEECFISARRRLRIVKFTFAVGVEEEPGQEGVEKVGPEVRLDAREHSEYVWATEEECRSHRFRVGTGTGTGVAREGKTGPAEFGFEFEFTTPAQEATVLRGFEWRRRARQGGI